LTHRVRTSAAPEASGGTKLAALLVVAAAVAVCAPALRNGLVWDDNIILEKQLSAFDEPLDLIAPPRDIPQFSPFYYRPAVILTYLIDRSVGGGAPWAFHATPILWHAVACLLLFFLCLRLLGSRGSRAATIGALVFAVHPAHAEAVAWMAGRGHVLATAGILAAALAWLRWLDRPRPVLLVAGAAGLLLGLLSKESAIASLPLLLSLPWVAGRNGSRPARETRMRIGVLWVSISTCALVYGVLRLQAIGTQLGVDRSTAVTAVEILGGLGFYAEVLLWPTEVGAVRTVVPTDAPHVALGLAAPAAGLIASYVAIRRRLPLVAWALLWIACGLAPALAPLVRMVAETPVADRYAYMPSVGVALLLAWLIARVPDRWARAAPIIAVPTLVAAGVMTARQATIWRDDISFWRNATAALPEEGFARLKLADALSRSGNAAKAEEMYERALSASRLSPQQRAVVQNNLGWLLLRGSRLAEAEPLFRQSLAAGPAFTGPYRGLVECLWPRGGDEQIRREIRDLLQKVLHLDPSYARGAYMLGQVSLADGDRETAVRWFERAIRTAPRSKIAEHSRTVLARLGAR
jgi:tetratricopeptide (TPR) repeat protein